ncbi:ATP synthase subunit I [Limnohabitans sp. Rim8]|jgi:ATP synthase protein I|uniref:ATP synthase subunit I n=1 Tax=Limnohabitans curvus TaxID=323423 RepID=A0A315EP39_9BURK|nr:MULTISPECIES: ATP synthase subunit I [Limnohabitans]PUE54912.1 ATP synthase subunit I [Limnohabitans sp. Rim8]PUE59533.1 ATP synthase subunit I [Limnohabitans curvus]
MTRIQPEDQENVQDAFEPLTAEQVVELRKQQPLLSVWRVVGVQVILGLLVAGFVWFVSGRMAAVYSALYGALTVIAPAALFARGLTSRVASVNVGAAVFGFFLWEMVKIGLTVAMLFAAPRLVSDLSWPAMLAGLVVTMKVYWVALGFRKVFYPVNPT